MTLFRLALNVSSARLILLNGNSGTTAAGEVIQAFGAFVVGGNYIIGIVIFLVLIAILLPVTIGFARVFAAVFELPFQRHRGWAPLRAAISAARRPAQTYGPAPGRASHARADAT